MARGGAPSVKKVKVTFRTAVVGMDALNRLMKRLDGLIKRFETLQTRVHEATTSLDVFAGAVGNAAGQLERAATAAGNFGKKQRGIAAGFKKRLTENRQMLRLQQRLAQSESGNAPTSRPRASRAGQRRGGGENSYGVLMQQANALKGVAQEMMFVVRAARAAAVVYAGIIAAMPARAFAEKALETSRRADFLGMTKQNFQELDAISKQFGAGEGDLMDMFGTLSDRSLDVINDTGYVEDFKLFGLTAKDLKDAQGNLKSTTDLFNTFADSVATIENPAERLGAIMRVLGDDVGRKMGPMLVNGAAGIEKMREEMRTAGVVFNDAADAIGINFAYALRKTNLILGAQYDFLGLSLIPSFQKFIDVVNRISLSNAPWLRLRLSELSKTWEKLGDVVGKNVEAFDAFLKKGGMQGGVYQLVEQLTWALGGLLAVFGLYNLPAVVGFLGVLGGIAAALLVIDDFLIYMGGGAKGTYTIPWEQFEEGAGKAAKAFSDMGKAVLRAWRAMNRMSKATTGEGIGSLLARETIDGLNEFLSVLESIARVLELMANSVDVISKVSDFGWGNAITHDVEGRDAFKGADRKTRRKMRAAEDATDRWFSSFNGTIELVMGDGFFAKWASQNPTGNVQTTNNNVNIVGSGNPGRDGAAALNALPIVPGY